MSRDRRAFLRLTAAGIAGLAGCTTGDDPTDTATRTGSPPSTATSTPTASPTPMPSAAPPALAWSADLGFDVGLAPRPTADGVVVGGAGGVAALDPDGETRWRHETDAALVHPPTLAPSGVYLTGPDGVERLDRDGAWQWSSGRPVEGIHPHVLAVGEGVVAIAQFAHEKDWTTLRALGVDLPNERWSAGVFGALEGTVVGGSLYLVGYTNAYAFALADGAEEWVVRKPNLRGDLVGVDRGVVVGRGAPAVVALDAADGTERWRRNRRTFDAALADGTVYVALSDRGPVVEARDVATGDERWRADALEGEPTIAAVGDDVVLVADAEGVHALDAASGDRGWFWLGDEPVRGVEYRDGVAYVRTPSALHAVEGGEVRWTFAPGPALGPLAAGEHGVFVGTRRDGSTDGAVAPGSVVAFEG